MHKTSPSILIFTNLKDIFWLCQEFLIKILMLSCSYLQFPVDSKRRYARNKVPDFQYGLASFS